MKSNLIPEPIRMPNEQPVQKLKLLGIEIDVVIDPRMREDTMILHTDREAVVWDGQAGTLTHLHLRRGAGQ